MSTQLADQLPGSSLATRPSLGSRDLDALGALLLWGVVFSAANGFMEELWIRGLFLGRLTRSTRAPRARTRASQPALPGERS